jgi:putative ABC transport system permease protein
VNINGNMDGNEFLTGNTPPTIGPALVNEFHEIESYVRIYSPGDRIVRFEENNNEKKAFLEKNILGSDSTFFQVFDYKMLDGDASSCLDHPNSVVLSEELALKYFGNTKAVGKIIWFDKESAPFTITGVLKSAPQQTTWKFDMLASISSFPVVKQFSWSWVWLQVNTYIKLRENVAVSEAAIRHLESEFPAMVKVQAASAFRRIGQSLEELVKKGGKWDFSLQPLTKVHLHSAGIGSRVPNLGDVKYVYIFSIIALFIIILACVNFMNLSTARSSQRAKEIGIRKVLGSEKGQLVRQFLTEAVLCSFISMMIALILLIIFIKPFNDISGKFLHSGLIFNNGNWLLILLLTAGIGLIAGSYPAFYLTSFKPVLVLKRAQQFTSRVGNIFIRNGLVVFQFTISTALIICTLIVFKQLNYIRSKDLGLDKENVIVISNSQRLQKSEPAFSEHAKQFPGIVNISVTSANPVSVNFADGYIPEPEDSITHISKDIGLPSFIIDYDFIPALKIQVVKGRNFSKEFSDSASVILNESAVAQIGWKNPIGRYLQYPGNSQRFKVIGVTKDFTFESLHNKIGAFALFHSSSGTYNLGTSYMLVRVRPDDMNKNIARLEGLWKKFAPDIPFDYKFLDEDFNALYSSEQRMGTVFGVFTILSIFVGCLGLFGLASFTAERRTKEIGIRKVLGASVQGLIALLSKDFIRLVLLSSIIAFPIAWWSMNKWLEDFAYRISIQWWVFFASASLAIIIAFLTVSIQAFKAAVANPVTSLRTE